MKFSDLFAHVNSVLATFVTGVGLVTSIYSYYESSPWLLAAGLVFILWAYLLFLRHSVKERLPGGVRIYRHPKWRNKKAVQLGASYWLLPPVFAVLLFVAFWFRAEPMTEVAEVVPEPPPAAAEPEVDPCQHHIYGTFDVLVHPFAQTFPEAFQSQLLADLGDVDNSHRIKARPSQSFLVYGVDTALESAIAVHCIDTGMVIYGHRDAANNVESEQVFVCHLELVNMFGNTEELHLGGDRFVIQHPPAINFHLRQQSQYVAEFAKALILYADGAFAHAAQRFEDVGTGTVGMHNLELSSWCNTYLGNIAGMRDHPEEAWRYYELAIEQDPQNRFARENQQAMEQSNPKLADIIRLADSLAQAEEEAQLLAQNAAPVSKPSRTRHQTTTPLKQPDRVLAPVGPKKHSWRSFANDAQFKKRDEIRMGAVEDMNHEMLEAVAGYLNRHPDVKIALSVTHFNSTDKKARKDCKRIKNLLAELNVATERMQTMWDVEQDKGRSGEAATWKIVVR